MIDIATDLYGLCRCGCGQRTSIAEQSRHRLGHIKGQPLPYIKGHSARVQYGPWAERFWSKVDKNGPTVRLEL
jgi:hypothetical protein